MGFLDRIFRRREPRPSRSRVTVTCSPDGFRIESSFGLAADSERHDDWAAVSGACHNEISGMKGIQIYTTVPPYSIWCPDDAEGVAELVAELERRGLLGPAGEVEPTWETKLAAILERTVADSFPTDDRDEAEKLLAPHRGSPRLALALVELSNGDLEALRKHTGWAGDDPNSAIYSAWYHQES